ncbi:hypothetical protein Goari_015771, partial [Gossypium aridum]|nr:hypothetical protein [Gossypium aridum]
METWRRLLTALHLQHINAAWLLQKPTNQTGWTGNWLVDWSRTRLKA